MQQLCILSLPSESNSIGDPVGLGVHIASAGAAHVRATRRRCAGGKGRTFVDSFGGGSGRVVQGCIECECAANHAYVNVSADVIEFVCVSVEHTEGSPQTLTTHKL